MFDRSPGDQDDEPHGHRSLAFENQRKFSGMFLSGRVGPHGLAKAQQLVVIRQLSEPDANIRRRPISLIATVVRSQLGRERSSQFFPRVCRSLRILL
jgi:hypothetical protein